MERSLFETVRRGASDVDFCVVSSTLAPELRERVDWKRVPVPRRPFLLKFALFYLLGWLRVALAGPGVRQTTGAIVPNRPDISVVHFCHAGYLAKARRSTPAVAVRLEGVARMARPQDLRVGRALELRPAPAAALRRGVRRGLPGARGDLSRDPLRGRPERGGPRALPARRAAARRHARGARCPSGRVRRAVRGRRLGPQRGGRRDRRGGRGAPLVWHRLGLWIVGPGDVERYPRARRGRGSGGPRAVLRATARKPSASTRRRMRFCCRVSTRRFRWWPSRPPPVACPSWPPRSTGSRSSRPPALP